MKPGDLVTIQTEYGEYRIKVAYVNVFKEVVNEDAENYFHVPHEKKWEQGEVGILLEGCEEFNDMVQVFHYGRVGWVNKDFLKKL